MQSTDGWVCVCVHVYITLTQWRTTSFAAMEVHCMFHGARRPQQNCRFVHTPLYARARECLCVRLYVCVNVPHVQADAAGSMGWQDPFSQQSSAGQCGPIIAHRDVRAQPLCGCREWQRAARQCRTTATRKETSGSAGQLYVYTQCHGQ